MTTSLPVDQATYWNGGAGETWVAQQQRLDRQLAPLGDAALAALAPQPGERILDIGCGAGATTAELAHRVGPAGQVTGVDVSAPLLAAARARVPGPTFLEADAQTHAFAPASFDALFSRFGVMFFAEPMIAFRNLATALAPGGRLAFVCWRAMEENPVIMLPLEAAIAAGLPAPPPSPDPHAPGPFAFADRMHVTDVLVRAGFIDVALAPHDAKVGGNDPAATLELALNIGPLGRLLREQPEHREAAIAAVRAALAPHVTDGVVLLPSATWVVTARV